MHTFNRHILPLLTLLACILMGLMAVVPAHAKTRSWRSARVSYHSPYDGFTLAARGVEIGTVYEFRVGGRVARGRVVDANGRKMRAWGRKFDLSDELFSYLFGGTRRGIGALQYRLVKRGRGRLIPD